MKKKKQKKIVSKDGIRSERKVEVCIIIELGTCK